MNKSKLLTILHAASLDVPEEEASGFRRATSLVEDLLRDAVVVSVTTVLGEGSLPKESEGPAIILTHPLGDKNIPERPIWYPVVSDKGLEKLAGKKWFYANEVFECAENLPLGDLRDLLEGPSQEQVKALPENPKHLEEISLFAIGPLSETIEEWRYQYHVYTRWENGPWFSEHTPTGADFCKQWAVEERTVFPKSSGWGSRGRADGKVRARGVFTSFDLALRHLVREKFFSLRQSVLRKKENEILLQKALEALSEGKKED